MFRTLRPTLRVSLFMLYSLVVWETILSVFPCHLYFLTVVGEVNCGKSSGTK